MAWYFSKIASDDARVKCLNEMAAGIMENSMSMCDAEFEMSEARRQFAVLARRYWELKLGVVQVYVPVDCPSGAALAGPLEAACLSQAPHDLDRHAAPVVSLTALLDHETAGALLAHLPCTSTAEAWQVLECWPLIQRRLPNLDQVLQLVLPEEWLYLLRLNPAGTLTVSALRLPPNAEALPVFTVPRVAGPVVRACQFAPLVAAGYVDEPSMVGCPDGRRPDGRPPGYVWVQREVRDG
ncbi:MAG: hypothetical protein JNM56_27295 [Planctomycetia bacterium]|nr:hypothetical protein [Planctomycetia bacterium]